ncbi:MAG TPA: hypothetical protein VGQ93_07825 [Lysobacter sp.]|nr:hypothetical protein [Lysobacter sp.]
MRYAWIQAQAGVAVRKLCTALEVSASGYYAWRTKEKREKRDGGNYAELRSVPFACRMSKSLTLDAARATAIGQVSGSFSCAVKMSMEPLLH